MKSIMLILNDEYLQFTLLHSLHRKYRITRCDSNSAVNALAAQHPDAVVMDLFLVETNGFSILEALEFRPQVVIMLTPLVTQSILDTADQLGCRLILKPCSVNYILSQLKERMGG